MLARLVRLLAIGAAGYIAVALLLVAWPMPAPHQHSGVATNQLGAFVRSGTLAEPAAAQSFKARDQATRLYRLYDGAGPDLLVLLHGSASDSRYLAKLARSLAAATGVTVATLDMRGHGAEPVRRGDVDAVSQQEQDIADLVGALRVKRPFERFLVGGHSIGGGLALRYAAGNQEPRPSHLLLLAPYIHRNSPAARQDSGGWATPAVARFAGVEMLQKIGVHAFDARPVLRFEVAAAARDGAETPVYSWRLFASVTPRPDWRAEINNIACPTLVLAAGKDPIFRSEGYPEIFKSKNDASVQIIDDIDHFELVTSDEVPRRVAAWLGSRR